MSGELAGTLDYPKVDLGQGTSLAKFIRRLQAVGIEADSFFDLFLRADTARPDRQLVQAVTRLSDAPDTRGQMVYELHFVSEAIKRQWQGLRDRLNSAVSTFDALGNPSLTSNDHIQSTMSLSHAIGAAIAGVSKYAELPIASVGSISPPEGYGFGQPQEIIVYASGFAGVESQDLRAYAQHASDALTLAINTLGIKPVSTRNTSFKDTNETWAAILKRQHTAAQEYAARADISISTLEALLDDLEGQPKRDAEEHLTKARAEVALLKASINDQDPILDLSPEVLNAPGAYITDNKRVSDYVNDFIQVFANRRTVLLGTENFIHVEVEKGTARTNEDIGNTSPSGPSLFIGFTKETMGQQREFFTRMHGDVQYILAQGKYDAATENLAGKHTDDIDAKELYTGNPLWVTAESQGYSEPYGAEYSRIKSDSPIRLWRKVDGEAEESLVYSRVLHIEGDDGLIRAWARFDPSPANNIDNVGWYEISTEDASRPAGQWYESDPGPGRTRTLEPGYPINVEHADGSTWRVFKYTDGSEREVEVGLARSPAEINWTAEIASSAKASTRSNMTFERAALDFLSVVSSYDNTYRDFEELSPEAKQKIIVDAWNTSWGGTGGLSDEKLRVAGFADFPIPDNSTISRGHLQLFATAADPTQSFEIAGLTDPSTWSIPAATEGGVPGAPGTGVAPSGAVQAFDWVPRVTSKPGVITPESYTQVPREAPEGVKLPGYVPPPIRGLITSASGVVNTFAGRIGNPNEELTGERAQQFLPILTSLMRAMIDDPDEFALHEEEYKEIINNFANYTMAEAQKALEDFTRKQLDIKESREEEYDRVHARAVRAENVRETRIANQRREGLAARQHVSRMQHEQKEAVIGVQKAMADAQQNIAEEYLAQARFFGPTEPGAKIGGAASYERIAEALGVPLPGFLPIGAPVPDLPQVSDIQAFAEALAEARTEVKYATEVEQMAGLDEREPIPSAVTEG